ncbi:uncharacterized protein [Neodiprion pinetum]|uniref:uncharacterized protein isoform X2 n=1 Tax=Neodiprion pinetum TaxID=441929 RepID=UPI001EE0254C|nr:uncharacterized protein LOC124221918 isoform X1 [Neodiprion pinetum]
MAVNRRVKRFDFFGKTGRFSRREIGDMQPAASERPIMPRLALLAAAGVFFYCCCTMRGIRLGGVEALELTRLDVPLFVDPRSAKVALRCEYDLEGAGLYSVKWYRNDFEFFRYRPGAQPPGQAFPLLEVKVDLERSDAEQITLLGQEEGVNLAGSYMCEVSTEGPQFLIKEKTANMSVAVVPKRDPVLEGVRPTYDLGELLQAECTSAPGYPPANLTFILNDKQVPSALTRNLTPDVTLPMDVGGQPLQLSTTRLGLTLRLERGHFPGSSLSLVCLSTLPGISAARARKTEVTSTLAASSGRLQQEPPAPSSATLNFLSINFLPLSLTVIIISGKFLDAELPFAQSTISRGY